MKKHPALFEISRQRPRSARNQTRQRILCGAQLPLMALALLLVLSWCQTDTRAEPKAGRIMEIGGVKRSLPPYRVFCPDLNQHQDGTTTDDHTRTHMNVLSWKAKKSTMPVSLVCVHALGLSAKAYADFGDSMSKLGIDTYAVDVRGFGENRKEEAYRRVNFRACFADLVAFLKHVKKDEPNKKIILSNLKMLLYNTKLGVQQTSLTQNRFLIS
ncbi:MAG: lysophospholipase [Cyanobacteria bacterium]|nr:lysophospholipase [Cyanobacteriota bacterium]